LKGLNCIPASLEIARQWHEGQGAHFAHRVCALARHYQVFEQLPVEKRGGLANTCCLLLEETIQTAAREWLTSQPVGQITPRLFQQALNSTILPTLNITLKKPLCKRTACQWLIKLGWRLTVLRKGVYMDGHEQDNVKKYWQEVFLPAMAKFEACMTRYEGPELRQVPPSLASGEKEIIANFHDECCFHVNDHKSRAW
jgi:hypothetical protein